MKQALFFTFFLVGFIPQMMHAQLARKDSIGWGEFVETYFETEAETADATERLADYETLEELHAAPMNLNTCSREELLLLPFIGAVEADSIIAYRDRRGFLSLGELLFIRPLTYTARLYLPLFVYIGPKEEMRESLTRQLTGGRYELETRLDVPLYTRDGNGPHLRSELNRNPNLAYHGNGLHHVMRLRYRYARMWAYGLTLEKDAGEPFGAEGNAPYDYISYYLQHRDRNGRWEWILGDYEVRSGQGLLFGGGFFLNKRLLATHALQGGISLKTHTSTEENDFLRGMAGRLRIGHHFEATAFASWRTLDASHRGDTILTLQTTGYHRTPTEIDRKDFAKALTVGGRAAYLFHSGEVGLTAYTTHFTQPVQPDLRTYNRYYFRGRTAAGFAADYSWHNNRWEMRGEAAADHKMHLAYSGTVRLRASDVLQIFFQHRHLSPRFISLHGHTLQEGARCANEHGGAIGATAQLGRRISLTGYADFFILPKAVYLNRQRTRGAEIFLQTDIRRPHGRSWQFIYRYKTKERGVTGHPDILEFVQTHRATLRTKFSAHRINLHPAVTVVWRIPQAGQQSFGWMTSLRSAWQPAANWQIGGFAALFMSDDYQSALYAYEPQLIRQSGIPGFYYHGFRLVATAQTHLFRGLEAGLRIGSTHYFNQNHIGSGTQLIPSSWKNDVSLQLRWYTNKRHRTSHKTNNSLKIK